MRLSETHRSMFLFFLITNLYQKANRYSPWIDESRASLADVQADAIPLSESCIRIQTQLDLKSIIIREFDPAPPPPSGSRLNRGKQVFASRICR